MAESAVYVPEKGFHLIERCLRQLPAGRLDLVCHPSRVGYARKLAEGREGETRVFDTSALSGPPPEWQGAEILLPLSVAQGKLKFVPRAETPDLRPYYPEFEILHRAGFRRFTLFTLFGTRTFSVPQLLYQFAGVHAGRPGVVVANGPSLGKIDLTDLRHHVTFGCNRVFYGFKDWGFSFKYWAIEDRLQVEEYHDEYRRNLSAETVNFVPFEYLPFVEYPNLCPVNHFFNPPEPRFSVSPEIVHHGFTVTHMLMQLACIMGCNPIYLVGLDHSYDIGQFDNPHGSFEAARTAPSTEDAGSRPQFWDQSLAKSDTHFHKDYTGGGKRFVPPRPVAAELAYANAARVMAEHGIKVYNASPGTKLATFPLLTADELHRALQA